MLKNSKHILFLLIITFSSILNAQYTKKMAITIDDLPITQNQDLSHQERLQLFRNILHAFENNHAKVTGFLVGNLYTKEDAVLIEEFIKAGHAIGNHTYSHQDLKDETADFYTNDIAKCEELLDSLREAFSDDLEKQREDHSKVVSGQGNFIYSNLNNKDKHESNTLIKSYYPEDESYYESPQKYFRYPFLSYGQTREKKEAVLNFLQENNIKIAPVTITSNDWKYSLKLLEAYKNGDESEMEKVGKAYVKHVLSEVNSSYEYSIYRTRRNINQIFLCHTNLLNSLFLDQILTELRNDGWQFVSLNEALKDQIYSWNDDYVGKEGIPWLFRVKKPRGIAGL